MQGFLGQQANSHAPVVAKRKFHRQFLHFRGARLLPAKKGSYGSRLCKNVCFEATGATIAFVRKRGRIIVATPAKIMIHYFGSVSEKLLLHSLGQKPQSQLTWAHGENTPDSGHGSLPA
jgi:hypothetical protein